VVGLAGWARLRLRAAPRDEVPQRRSGHRRRRQVLLRALSRHLRARPQGQGRRRRDAGRRARALPAQAAVARLHDVLRHARDRRRLGRTEEVRRASGGGRLSKGADRRRALSVRLLHTRDRAGPGSVRGLLAQESEREAAGAENDPGPGDAASGAQARRSGHRLLDDRRARRRGAAHAGAHVEGRLSVDPLALLRRPVGREVALARSPCPPRRESRDRPARDRSGANVRTLADHVQHHSDFVRFLLATARVRLRSGRCQAAPRRGRVCRRLRCRRVLLRT
jgi:hypothetical protein